MKIIKVIDFLRHAETNLGIFDNQNHELWHSVIKPWFQPERFGITYLIQDLLWRVSYRWLKTPIERINREFGYWFPTYKKYIPYRIRILKLALKDLERIKEEYGNLWDECVRSLASLCVVWDIWVCL